MYAYTHMHMYVWKWKGLEEYTANGYNRQGISIWRESPWEFLLLLYGLNFLHWEGFPKCLTYLKEQTNYYKT